MVNYEVIYSHMAFQVCTNRVHIGMFNISSGFFLIQKNKILLGILTVFAFRLNWGCAYRKHEGTLIGGFTCRTGSVGGAYFYCLKLIGWLIIIYDNEDQPMYYYLHSDICHFKYQKLRAYFAAKIHSNSNLGCGSVSCDDPQTMVVAGVPMREVCWP